MEVIVVTTRRVRHGIVLALAGLLAGLGIVAALFWDGGLGRLRQSATGDDAAGSRAAIADLPTIPPGVPSSAPQGDRQGDRQENRQDTRQSPPATATPAAGPREATPPGAPPRDKAETPPPAADAPPGTQAAGEAPRFDIVRVEPNGDAVIAGRAKPNIVVEMLVDGQPVARALTDPSGQFAIVPPPLPRGSSEIVLRSKSADGRETRSAQSIAVSVAPNGDTQPLVALTSPDAPTVVLSQPGAASAGAAARPDPGVKAAGAPNPAGRTVAAAETSRAGGDAKTGGEAKKGADARKGADAKTAEAGASAAPLRIVSVDGEGSGRLFITGVGRPGSEVRLYLNDTLIAPAKVGPDGRVAFTIGKGISAGRYKIRVEEADPATGKVAHRAEVAFAMPEPPAAPPVTPQALTEAPAAAARPGTVFVPEITTARITRGDNLWQISKRTYGRGQRYTVIFDANQDQIRDPDLIYPGQTLVLPIPRRG